MPEAEDPPASLTGPVPAAAEHLPRIPVGTERTASPSLGLTERKERWGWGGKKPRPEGAHCKGSQVRDALNLFLH